MRLDEIVQLLSLDFLIPGVAHPRIGVVTESCSHRILVSQAGRLQGCHHFLLQDVVVDFGVCGRFTQLIIVEVSLLFLPFLEKLHKLEQEFLRVCSNICYVSRFDVILNH